MSARCFLVALLGLAACSNDTSADGDDCTGDTQYWVVDRLFFEVVENNVAKGFDLDGRTSDFNDAASCFQADLTSPEGTPGIDNQLAVVVSEVENSVGDVFNATTQASVNDGQLIFIFAMEGLSDPENDSCVGLSVQRGVGQPLLGTDGALLPFQTFGVNPDAGTSRAPNARLENGALLTEPFLLSLGLDIQSVAFDFNLYDAKVQLTMAEEGRIEGFFGGALNVQEVSDAIAQNDDQSFTELVSAFLRLTADLSPDPETGACQDLSAALSFSAVPAFVYEEP